MCKGHSGLKVYSQLIPFSRLNLRSLKKLWYQIVLYSATLILMLGWSRELIIIVKPTYETSYMLLLRITSNRLSILTPGPEPSMVLRNLQFLTMFMQITCPIPELQ